MSVGADHRRRALRALVHSLNGRQEWFSRVHGISAELVADLIEAGLATMQVEHRTTRGGEINVRHVRITDAGRQALAEWRRGQERARARSVKMLRPGQVSDSSIALRNVLYPRNLEISVFVRLLAGTFLPQALPLRMGDWVPGDRVNLRKVNK
jgi:DNA-binding PadR family transcriptional regulator